MTWIVVRHILCEISTNSEKIGKSTSSLACVFILRNTRHARL